MLLLDSLKFIPTKCTFKDQHYKSQNAALNLDVISL